VGEKGGSLPFYITEIFRVEQGRKEFLMKKFFLPTREKKKDSRKRLFLTGENS